MVQVGFAEALLSAGDRGKARTCNLRGRRPMLYPVERRGQPRELQSLISIVMAQLDPLRSKIVMIAIVTSMSLLVGLIAAAIATD